MPETDRRTALLDATLQLIASGGLRAVTHRAVEQAVGLPHGSTTYYFKTRDQLINAAVDRLAELDHERVDAIAHAVTMALARRTERLEPNLDAIGLALSAWLEEERGLQIARFELFLEGTRRPELRDALARCHASFSRVAEPLALAAGSDDPARDGRLLVALVNGVLMDQITEPAENFATEIAPVAVRKIIAAMAA
ncbi:MAG TPA: TetR family transcriptional regulator [Solirubrobacteraceae bacterium]|jgi:DNA-binding transcriptional regulator YbjK